MNNSTLKEIKSDILKYKIENIEEFLSILCIYLETYVKCGLTFGFESEVINDTNKLFGDFKKILDLEKRYLNFLKHEQNKIEHYQIQYYIDLLSSIKEDELLYYIGQFEDFIEASELNRDYRAKITNKSFESILNNQDLNDDIVASSYTIDDVLDILHIYNNRQDLLDIIVTVDRNFEEDIEFGLYNNSLVLPTIVDKESLLMNIELIYNAYITLYCNNQGIDNLDDFIKYNFQLKKIC